MVTRLSIRCARLLAKRSKQHGHSFAFEPERLFNVAMRSKRFGQLLKKCPPDLRVCIFSTTEKNGEFDLIPIVQKFGGALALGLEIVIIDLRADAHFLQLNNVLILARFAFLPALLIAELAVIHEPTNRRNCVRRNLDKIQTTFTRHFKRITSLNNTDLIS